MSTKPYDSRFRWAHALIDAEIDACENAIEGHSEDVHEEYRRRDPDLDVAAEFRCWHAVRKLLELAADLPYDDIINADVMMLAPITREPKKL